MPVDPKRSNRQSTSYLGFHCASCLQVLVVFTIPASMKTPRNGAPADVVLVCRKCGHESSYSTSDVKRFEVDQVDQEEDPRG